MDSGVVEIYWKNGNLRNKYFVNNEKIGERKSYYENGQINTIYNYINGIQNGKNYIILRKWENLLRIFYGKWRNRR